MRTPFAVWEIATRDQSDDLTGASGQRDATVALKWQLDLSNHNNTRHEAN